MVRAVLLLTLLAGIALAAADDDPVKKKLAVAKAEYDAKIQKYQDAVAKWFDKREDTIRKAGDKKALDLLKMERMAFEQTGALPKTIPDEVKKQVVTARASFDAALVLAVKEYTKAKMDDEAGTVEKALQDFRAGDEVVVTTRKNLLGTWKIMVGSYKGDWTFNEDGTVDSSSTGPKSGKWTIDLSKKEVLITWGKDLADKFDLPLNPKSTGGAQVGRGKLKLMAVKVP